MKTRKNYDEDDNLVRPKDNIVLVDSQSVDINKYNLYITRSITEPSDFQQEINFLNALTQYDTVDVIINSGGGLLSTALLLRDALINTPAHTNAVIGVDCASAATIIALSCKTVTLNEFSTFMIHPASFGLPDGHAEYMDNILQHNKRLLSDLVNIIYKKFLTQKEINYILDGHELYMRADEIQTRWDKMRGIKNESATGKPKQTRAKQSS
jgi:ATP-dependent protease ClpP protease subunit